MNGVPVPNVEATLAAIDDLDRFVHAAIHALGLTLSASERDELHGEGFLILCELADEFTPALAHRWSFVTYAGEWLPRRLITAWHRMHRGSHVRVRVGGRCVWQYRPAAASLDWEIGRRDFDESRVVPITRFQKPPRERLAA